MSDLTGAILRFRGQAIHLVKSNSPAILTAIGVSGTVTTAYLASKASYEAAGVIRKAEMGVDDLPTDFRGRLQSRLPYVWRLYIPAALSGSVTIGCIIAVNTIGTRRTATAAAAYTLSEKAFAEYKDKVAETIGENKEGRISDAVAVDQVTANPPSQSILMMAEPGKVVCHDPYTGRYFHSDMEALKRAELATNLKLTREQYATMNDFYEELGVYCSENADDMGWEDLRPMELSISAVLYENVPILSFRYNYVKLFF